MSSKDDWKHEARLKIDVLEVWNEVQRHIADEKTESEINRNSRWKTIRIFVSSTFTDFHTERNELVKEIFPDLREWCQKRDLHLVECDLRWGVPEETPYCVTLQVCLNEIRKCEQENKFPFFLNMISKRAGWIPVREELTEEVIREFDLVIGLSATEMEIVEAAYRKGNPNSLFMWRDSSFMDQITDEKVRKEFLDELYPFSEKRISVLKEKVQERFPNQIFRYSCNYIPGKKLSKTKRTQLELDPSFKETVMNFFKQRIEEQYPYEPTIKLTRFEMDYYQQEGFMEHRAERFVDQGKLLENIKEYVRGSSRKPLVLLGESGSGKSTAMARVVRDLLKFEEGRDSMFVFFHFVGATPSSTSLVPIMRRILYQMKERHIPTKKEEVLQTVKNILQSDKNYQGEFKKTVIIIDAINQLDDDDLASANVIYSWLPMVLPPMVKCVVSMIPGSDPHKIVAENPGTYLEETACELEDLLLRKEIASRYLINYRKKLSQDQILELLNHKGSTNPLWLITACEELRFFGEFSKLTEHIKSLPSNLDALIFSVLERICHDIEDKDLLVATLCLLECSKNGLLEVELLEMLANLDTKTNYEECAAAGDDRKLKPRLLSYKWGFIYHHLKNFLRPYGDSGEGRLDFYHRSLSKVVRENYLKDIDLKMKYHCILAVHFETSPNMDRKIEEYPYHLEELGDKNRLRKFLLDWDVFLILYDSEYSQKLLKFWRFVDETYEELHKGYSGLVEKWNGSLKITKEVLFDNMDKVARLYRQAGLLKQAMELSLKCLDLLEQMDKNEECIKNSMYLSGFLGHLELTLNKNYNRAIELHTAALKKSDQLQDQQDYFIKRYVALQNIKKAFCLGEQANQTRGIFKGNAKAKVFMEAQRLCHKAITIYTEIGDHSHLLEAKLTEATLVKDHGEVHKLLQEVIRECRSMYGHEHHLITRALYNDGVEYETERKLDEAYDRFRSAYLLAKLIFGRCHSTTQQYREVLNDQRYKKIVAKRKDENVDEVDWTRADLP